MRPFPPSSDLKFFVGDAIAQIKLDPHGLQFEFESRRYIAAEFAIEHCEPNGTVWRYDCIAANGPPLILHRLLYRPIVAVEGEALRLVFTMDDGASLTIMSDLGPYEAGHIRTTETGLIVF